MSVTPEQIVKRHLSRTARKHWRNVLCDIQAVFCGVKPSFLYDYSSMDSVRLSKMIADLQSSGLVVEEEYVRVLSLGEELFVTNITSLQTAVQGFRHALLDGRGSVVDVSSQRGHPGLADEAAIHQLLNHSGDILAQVRDYTTMVDTVMKLQPKPDWNFSSMFGVLLGYPVVYWYDDIKDASNCLSMVPLRVYSVSVDPDYLLKPICCSREFQEDNALSKTSHEHSIYSFSVPETLVPHLQERIGDWFKELQKRSPVELRITDKSVTLPAVAL